MRASLIAAASLALTGVACATTTKTVVRTSPGTGPGGPGTTTAPAPGGSGGQPGQGAGAGSNFRASVASASGAYAGEGGRAEISVQAHGSGASRPVKLAFRSLPCRGAPQCVQLDGTLVGAIATRRAGPPDVGRSFSVTANGRLSTLGRVTATGIGHGTGFIARGRETLDLTLTSRSGRITLRAVSGTVRGFTSP